MKMAISGTNPMKTDISQLAVMGGEPQFGVPLHVGRPNLGNRERLLGRINEMLDSRWFSNNGPFVQEFEKEVAERIGVRHCIAMCNVGLLRWRSQSGRQACRARSLRPFIHFHIATLRK